MRKQLTILIFSAWLSGCADSQPPAPVEITTPVSVSSTTYPSNSFLIEIRSDNSVWYKLPPLDDGSKPSKKVDSPIVANLAKLIGDFKKEHGDEKISWLIKGDKEVKFTVFKSVTDALRTNNEFKYQLVTTNDDEDMLKAEAEKTSLNLKEPKPDPKVDSALAISKTKLTLILLHNNKIYGYVGNEIAKGRVYDYSNVRSEIIKQSKKFGDRFLVLIKTANGSTSKNAVDMLDEMTADKIKRFAMVDLNEEELNFINKLDYH